MPTKPSDQVLNNGTADTPRPLKQRRVVTVVARSGGYGRQLSAAAQLERSGKYDAAVAIYREILRASPEHIDTLIYLGRCLSMADRPRKTIMPLESALARRLTEFCGLDWEDGVLDFHRLERPVFTASQRQVRQPIYKGSVGKWRKYERHLTPFIAGIGELLD